LPCPGLSVSQSSRANRTGTPPGTKSVHTVHGLNVFAVETSTPEFLRCGLSIITKAK
jgi:hypothetical protein